MRRPIVGLATCALGAALLAPAAADALVMCATVRRAKSPEAPLVNPPSECGVPRLISSSAIRSVEVFT